ncbi:Mediator of RNA polymerase II transcription subunit 8 [Raphanus sativus]|nr:Mediator of RNA polymerase II transcription subunit 8 [Raphanus sativus]
MERATQPPPVAEELTLDYMKIQAQSLQKAISRLLEDFDAYTHTKTTPKWKDILGKYKMINLDLFILVEEVKQVSKDFDVFPKNVNAENAAILPVMLATKLLPEMETDNKVKIDQLLHEVQSLPIPTQIETLKERIGKIAEACEDAVKVLADARKAYGLAPDRGGPSMPPTPMEKAQAAKIKGKERMLRAAVNDGIRLPPDQREITTALPPHMVDALFVNNAVFNSSGIMQTQQSQSQSQQPEQQQGDYGNMQANQQNLQPDMLQNAQQSPQ